MSRSDSLSTIERAFEVLDLLWELDGAGPTELSRRMNLPDSTVYEYLRSLSETKYVVREKGEYRLSAYFLTVAGQMRYRNQLFQVAKPEMRRVADETGELVGLTVEDAGFAVVLHQEEGERALSLGTYPGASTPLHTTAGGKVILAHLPADRVEELVYGGELVARTDHSVTDPDELVAEFETIRSDGYGIDWDEQVVGMGMIAVPLLVDDHLLGSAGIVVPTGRIRDPAYQEELLQYLEEMENTVTINYQYGRQ